jgi:hypothetical protein
MRYVQVAGRPLHDKYFMWCMVRRAARELAFGPPQLWHSTVAISPVERGQMRELLDEACKREAYTVSHKQENEDAVIIFTDATERSWGSVRILDHALHVTSGVLLDMDICEAEAIAAVEGLLRSPPPQGNQWFSLSTTQWSYEFSRKAIQATRS